MGWSRGSNISPYRGQHQSFWQMKSSQYTIAKHKGSERGFRVPLSFVIGVSGDSGGVKSGYGSNEAGDYTLSWFMGVSQDPNPIFHPAIVPAYEMMVHGTQYILKPNFSGTLFDVNQARAFLANMISKTGDLPTVAEFREKLYRAIRDNKFKSGYTLSNWAYAIEHPNR